MKEKIRELIKKINYLNLFRNAEFAKFCMVGISNTILSYIINIVTLCILKPLCLNWDYIVGNITSFLLSVLWSFYWNNKYVFLKQTDKNKKEPLKIVFYRLMKMYLAYGITGIILCNILSYIWISVCGIHRMVAPIMNLVISVPLNYIVNKFWTFKQ